MNSISAEIVESTRQKIDDYTVEQGEQLARQFSTEQPALMTFLMTVDQATFDENERELLFYTGAVVWQMMAQGGKPLPAITEEMIANAEEANKRFLEPIAGLTDADRVLVIRTLFQTYQQPDVLKYVVRALTEAVQHAEVRADHMGVILFDLKTEIDCMDASVG